MDDDAEHPRRGEAGAIGDPTGGARVAVCPEIHTEVFDTTNLLSQDQRDWLRRLLHAALREIGTGGEIRVRLVDDAAMATAHKKFGGVEGTTDVLTFDMRDEEKLEPSSGVMDVDIWACVDEARRQAAARGIAAERELLLYCLHGVLHCLGHDDHDEQGFARMHAEEDRVLEAIGVGRTFAADPRPRTGGERA